MKLDLLHDRQLVRDYITTRIKEYANTLNCGPGDSADPIQAVRLGFYAAQGGYIYLVFDTRPGENFDNEWSAYLDESNMRAFPLWYDFYEKACGGKAVTLVLDDGTEKHLENLVDKEDDLIDEEAEAELNAYFGNMLKNVLSELKNEGLLSQ